MLWQFDGEIYAKTSSTQLLEHRVKKHQSVLVRNGKGMDTPDILAMQYNKVDNLKVVIQQLDGMLIHPGEVFSFCKLVGNPTAKRGFKLGMELSRGEARPGIGGGICQASNLIYWLVLHSPLSVIERHHHSFDPFPDSGRILPFASGATVMYNYRDLRFKNNTADTFQLRLWLDKKCLNGDLRSDRWITERYSVYERAHQFSKANEQYFRSNELWRKITSKIEHGKLLADEFVIANHAEVKYVPDSDQLA